MIMQAVSLPKEIAPKVPKDFVTAPIFPPKKQIGPRELMIRDVKWTIGVSEPNTEQTPSPAFDIRHGERVLPCFPFVTRISQTFA